MWKLVALESGDSERGHLLGSYPGIEPLTQTEANMDAGRQAAPLWQSATLPLMSDECGQPAEISAMTTSLENSDFGKLTLNTYYY